MGGEILPVRILITDDSSDIRVVLKSLCRHIEGVELFEAADGSEAVEKVASCDIDLILMDLMMPVMDGFEATRRIKKAYPNTMIVAITSLIDAETERKIMRIGATGFLRKPITDPKITRARISSFVAYIRTAQNTAGLKLRETNAKNPFSNEIRVIKSRAVITNEDELMDFSLWLTERYMNAHDMQNELFRQFCALLFNTISATLSIHVTASLEIEENFDWLFISVSLYQPIDEATIKLNYPMIESDHIRIEQNMLHIRQRLREHASEIGVQSGVQSAPSTPKIGVENIADQSAVAPAPKTQPASANATTGTGSVSLVASAATGTTSATQPPKVTRNIEIEEQQMLRQSRTEKINAEEYMESLGSDNADEIRDMDDTEEEWSDTIAQLSEQFSIENAHKLSRALGSYSSIVNRLIEFETLAYALASMSQLIGQLEESALESSNQMLFTALMRGLLDDMRKWRNTIFVARSTPDIHYLDSSLLSSCMQIESLLLNQTVATGDDDGLELF